MMTNKSRNMVSGTAQSFVRLSLIMEYSIFTFIPLILRNQLLTSFIISRLKESKEVFLGKNPLLKQERMKLLGLSFGQTNK